MPSKSKVCFFFEDKKTRLERRTELKQFIESLFRREKKALRVLNYIFCSDKMVLDINRRFLGHDFYTDIISFDLSGSGAVEGEIYISVDRVRENARKLEQSFKTEIHRVIFHGALHLCGYKDEKNREKMLIRQKEDRYLALYHP